MRGDRSSALWSVLVRVGLFGTAVPGCAEDHASSRHRLVRVGRPGKGA
jgi:hypothetical protein